MGKQRPNFQSVVVSTGRPFFKPKNETCSHGEKWVFFLALGKEKDPAFKVPFLRPGHVLGKHCWLHGQLAPCGGFGSCCQRGGRGELSGPCAMDVFFAMELLLRQVVGKKSRAILGLLATAARMIRGSCTMWKSLGVRTPDVWDGDLRRSYKGSSKKHNFPGNKEV